MPLRIDDTFRWTFSSSWSSLPVVLALVGGGTLLGRLTRPGSKSTPRPRWKATAVFALLVLLTLATILIQGKTHCRYHFHPFFWALPMAGVVALQSAVGARAFVSLARPAALVTCDDSRADCSRTDGLPTFLDT